MEAKENMYFSLSNTGSVGIKKYVFFCSAINEYWSQLQSENDKLNIFTKVTVQRCNVSNFNDFNLQFPLKDDNNQFNNHENIMCC